ncbi:hypothetical protein PBY51_011234 [Eleginops maclovinus]|uniref:Zinc finger and BTB domain containing 24 n=1 Tax=Eleginops maclovinus TaxID=56733 RepID=A0AAN7X9L4_ELEMC|nr:hypothetical protein PBY51_011234 [Eleginops maclovinus]
MSPAADRSSPLRTLHSDSHQQSILGKLSALRQQDILCDVTLQVQDETFRAHRALLAASSDHFLCLFTAQPQSCYRLQDVSAETLAAVLHFIYSAQVCVQRDTQVCVQEDVTQQLLAAAKLLQVSELITALSEHRRSAEELKEVQPELQEVGVPKVQEVSKRKRGRPRKRDQREGSEAAEVLPDDTESDVLHGDAESESKGDADYNPASVLQSRQSKRKIRPPVKYKSYRVSGEETGSREPGKKGRKRKYPATEARCEDCGKVFKNHLFLKIHQRTHTGEKPFPCLVCGKAFTQKHTLLVHQRMHSGEKPFVCNVCSKSLSTKHALQEHMHLHQGGKPFSCDKCGKSFTQKRQLKSHQRVHTGKSLPECAQCHHKFLDTAQLKKHLRTHTGEKPFTCEICGKCFTAKSTLQTHIRIHREEKPYSCSLCSRSFSDPSARRRHQASHSGRKPFSCSSCNLSFTRLDNLKTHSKAHSKECPQPPSDPPTDTQQQERGVLQQYQLPPSSQQQIQLVVTDDLNFVPGQNQEISIITTEGGGRGGWGSRGGRLPLQQTHTPPPGERGPGGASSPAGGPSQTSEQIPPHHIQGQTFQIQAGTLSYLYPTNS